MKDISKTLRGTTRSVGGRNCETTQKFRIKAHGDGTKYASRWSSWSSSFTGDTLGCEDVDQLSSLSIDNNGQTWFDLSWNAVTGAKGYRISVTRYQDGIRSSTVLEEFDVKDTRAMRIERRKRGLV